MRPNLLVICLRYVVDALIEPSLMNQMASGGAFAYSLGQECPPGIEMWHELTELIMVRLPANGEQNIFLSNA